ncbi:MAG: hypothetical protein CVV64_00120 [Candidatus Wallbacteria bacterium HGW-Wallbacteria-1]|jgi:3-hydroxymyristoyl/3-hydroxydecanoyl-(acyl carrier protein) dehydratase|uniref:Beta-hydroxyacyl-ACP dehydratase n=1 Tax=Candidatus Wallbacteria bacterium HGW-Wallbacteria-1 TaxID=2013854 RepID=A0A2N1PU59_9BACT|nr:MAG: hypothetical protein CVV64_00120 [Candidatus Wallbacteria bacterium HGW-Wallbacteria-1]
MKFRLVDKITSCVAESHITGVKALSLEEYFLMRPLGVRNEFPPTLMAESLFQLGNYLIYSTWNDKLGNLVMFNSIEIIEPLVAGKIMEMRVDLISRIDDTVKLNGTGWIDGRTAIRGMGCVATLLDIEQLVNPEKFDFQFRGLCESHFYGESHESAS